MEYLLTEPSKLDKDPIVRFLTQRLYGDYRQIRQTQEFKRAEKHVNQFKNTGIGKLLF